MTTRGFVWLLILCSAGYLWFAGHRAETDKAARLVVAREPADVAALLLAKNAAPQVERAGSFLAVTYSIPNAGSAATLRLSFSDDAIAIIPELFHRFSDLQEIEIRARAPFQDVRGNRTEHEALRMAFTRGNAATVQWQNMLRGDVPKVADRYWSHPGVRE